MPANHAGAILRHLRRFAEAHAPGALTDGQLLKRFADHGEEEAFAALMRRHGGLVWNVCRHILHRHHDAEDAFQATFLVLARRAASIRQKESVAGWLHGVAQRIAVRAKQMTAKRLERERQAARSPGAGARSPGSGARSPDRAPELGDAPLRDLQALLDEEVARL